MDWKLIKQGRIVSTLLSIAMTMLSHISLRSKSAWSPGIKDTFGRRPTWCDLRTKLRTDFAVVIALWTWRENQFSTVGLIKREIWVVIPMGGGEGGQDCNGSGYFFMIASKALIRFVLELTISHNYNMITCWSCVVVSLSHGYRSWPLTCLILKHKHHSLKSCALPHN